LAFTDILKGAMEGYSTDPAIFVEASVIKRISQTLDLVNHLDTMGFGLQLVEFNF